MSWSRGLLALAIVSTAAACTFTEPLSGLTGGAGSGDGGGSDAESDAGPDTTANDASDAGDAGDASDVGTGADAGDATTAMDASDGGATMDVVVQPDVATGPVSCADAGVILCEDFENGLDTTKWQQMGNYATTVVDGTQHHRGSAALHASMPALTTDGSLVNPGADIRHYVSAALPSPVFVRAFVMFSSVPPQATEQFFLGQQANSPYYGLQLEVDNTSGDYAVTDWTVSPTYYSIGTVGAAAATWNCVEWELDPPASGTTTTNSDVWIDGAEVSSLHLTNTPMSDLEVLGFGIGFFQVSSLPAADVWIDDIYVDTSRVGCDK